MSAEHTEHGPLDTPESIPRRFVEAWNARDADAIADLFDEDAEFVNVTGLWWHDREAIRRAHAYGLQRIFNESMLRLRAVRVKILSDTIAVVHARMSLSGQTAVGDEPAPGARTNIFSFVVHKRGGERMRRTGTRLMRVLIAMGGALAIVPLGAQQERPGEPPRVSAQTERAGLVEPSAVAERAIRRTNDYRAEQGLHAVEVSAELREASRYFAEYMARSGRYGHTADGNQPSERAEAHGYEICIVTENIANVYREQGFSDEDALAQEVVQGWIESPPHRRNMVDADVTEIGVGVARSEESGAYYAVQMFGRPQAQAIEFSLANEWHADVDYTLDGHPYTLQPGQVRRHGVCRPPEVELALPGRRQLVERTLRPRTGDRFVIAGRNGEGEPEVIRR